MFLLIIAGVGAIVAGLLAIWVGVPVKEFSFGNTMILAGVVAICGGLLMIGLALVVRELRRIARRLEPTESIAAQREVADLPLPAGSLAGVAQRYPEAGLPPSRRPPREERDIAMPPPAPSPSWRDEAIAQERGRSDAAYAPAVHSPEPSPEEPPPAPVKARRNLLFSSSRADRERASARTEPTVAAGAPNPEADDGGGSSAPEPHPSFANTWPRPERARNAAGASLQRPAAPSPALETEPEIPNPARSPVTVVKSGVVDGMAYSLYSDGSIEAQMPEGMMRFASIDELRKHLDQRS